MTSTALAPEALADLSSDALTSRLSALVAHERLSLVHFLWHLAEMDRRRIYLELGYPSIFAWCTEVLRLPKASAWRRITSARLMVRFPVAADYLADGRLCLTTFVLLRDLLEPENHRDLLDRAAGRTEDEVKRLVATLQPRPEVPESIRRLPNRAPADLAIPLLTSGPERRVDSRPADSAAPAEPSSGPERTVDTSHALLCTPAGTIAPAAPRPRIEPIDAQRHSVKLTVGPEFMAELAEVKAALSHLVPDGNLETVLRVCFQKTLEVCARRKHGTLKSAAPKPARAVRPESSAGTHSRPELAAPTPSPTREHERSPKPSRYIEAAVRRTVWARDGGACTFVGANGKRCGSRHRVEFDHIEPFARGGSATAENLTLRCREHNLHRARLDFGEAHMAKFSGPRGSSH